MKISISGTHSTGKSSFVQSIASSLRGAGVSFGIVGDLAAKCPLAILRKQGIAGTIWITATAIAKEVAASDSCEVVIVDRSVVDPWAYLHSASTSPSKTTEYDALERIVESWVGTYDLMYKTVVEPNISIENNGLRDLDPAYRAAVDASFSTAFQRFDLNPRYLAYSGINSELRWLWNFFAEKGLVPPNL